MKALCSRPLPIHATRVSPRARLAVLTLAMLVGAIVLPHCEAYAQLTKDQRKCMVFVNSGLLNVDKATTKQVRSCLKQHAKGKPLSKDDPSVDSLEECVVHDERGRILKQKNKVLGVFVKRCTGNDKNGDPKLPPFGSTVPAAVNEAGMQKGVDLIHDVFGADLDSGVLATQAADKPAAKCQDAVVKSVLKCEQTKLKEFLKCKKNGLKGKTPPGVILNLLGLRNTCLGFGANGQPDAKGKIAKQCADPKRGIQKGLQKKCVDKGQDLSSLFPTCSSADPGTVAQCLDVAVECRVCLALNRADYLGRDCDLFDDGVANVSCLGEKCVGCPIVFVTSDDFAGDFGGLADADQHCADAATNGGLSGTFLAWLSDDTDSPSTRFPTQSTIPYVRTDGAFVAASWSDLTDGNLITGISTDEFGQFIGVPFVAWTGTASDGTLTGENCDEWTDANGAGPFLGTNGQPFQTRNGWTAHSDGNCATGRRLYCFES